jgi:uncharacterized repeat protein (TIGR03803 family)
MLTSVYSFTGGNDGGVPYGELARGKDGDLYGTTAYGGTNNLGTVFRITTNGNLTSLYSFTGTNDGASPNAGLVQGTDGRFYGTTLWTSVNPITGPVGVGTVFAITTDGVLTLVHMFTGATNDGATSTALVVHGNNGNLYGTTVSGGLHGVGTVFRLGVEPAFQHATLTNTLLNLTWSTEVGGRYQLQYNSNLISGNWTNLTSIVVATGATLSAADFVTNSPRRFYRAVFIP